MNAENIICAYLIIQTECTQVTDRQLVDAVFISRINLLCGAEDGGQLGLLEISVFAQLAKNLPILFQIISPQKEYIYAGYGVLTYTPYLV